MKKIEELPDPKAQSVLQRLETEFELTVRDLRELLVGPNLPDRLAAAGATSDLFERLRGWQWQGPVAAPAVLGIEITQSVQFFRPPVNIVGLPVVLDLSRKMTFRWWPERRRCCGSILRTSRTSQALSNGAPCATAWSRPLPALNAPFDPPVNPIAGRGSLSASLNFRLPASECIGELEVRLSFQGTARAQESRLLRDFFGHLHIQRGVAQFWATSTAFTLRFQPVRPLASG
jgi:hypothetical protein